LIDRFGYLIREYRLTASGECPACGTKLPGIWPGNPAKEVKLGEGWADYYQRLPKRVAVSE
jgi:hypothetical protein